MFSSNGDPAKEQLIESIAFDNFDTGSVVSMESMFDNCRRIRELDLSGWDTANVTNMDRMFYSCDDLTRVFVSDKWSTLNVSSGYDMFNGSTGLVGGADTTYDPSYVDMEYARIDDPSNGRPGYFTDVTQRSSVRAARR